MAIQISSNMWNQLNTVQCSYKPYVGPDYFTNL